MIASGADGSRNLGANGSARFSTVPRAVVSS